MNKNNALLEIIIHKLDDIPPGIFSICSANPYVLKACIKKAREENLTLLIESTCNQVNQYGGYMNMKPRDFTVYIKNIALDMNFPEDNVCLGGDHLGPSVWVNEPADVAMGKAKNLVQEYVLAGYRKIHLDTSMSCMDDPVPLQKSIIAERQAQLCQVAEEAYARLNSEGGQLLYVVGTEVPTPGGAVSEEGELEVTSTQETIENIQMTKDAFHLRGLDAAWDRTIAFVVQPGVEFSDTQVHMYNRNKAAELSALIEKEEYDNLVYEAHSTDYQLTTSLKEMVCDHFAILKVGPALTFAMREAIFALCLMEKELLYDKNVHLSNVIEILDQAMVEKSGYWKKYYSGDPADQKFKRKYSYSDRSRYYWSEKKVTESTQLMINNLSSISIPLSLISQYLPAQYEMIRAGELQNNPVEMIYSKVISVLEDYIFACHLQTK